MRLSIQSLQPLGRALMLPIAVLPIAGLLLRLGQPDLLGIAFMAEAGAAVFDNLGLLFAVGIAVGFARDGNGAAGLAGVVCYLVVTRGAATLLRVPPGTAAGLSTTTAATVVAAFRSAAIAKLSVPIGIVSGVIAGSFYNRFSGVALPDYLAFFGGRRLVPILAGLAGLVLAGLVGIAYAPIVDGMDAASAGVIRSGVIGLFLYGVLNRLLIVTGLHHILNNVAWFLIGDFHGSTGDLNRFFAGDPSAGGFMTGFFPVMMFGLPAACLAMYHTARPERRRAVGGLYLSMALTALLTGVTEPIEFSFMFAAPLLYALHALLTGLAMVAMNLLGVKLGFTFSAGLLDYALNFTKATRPLLLIPVGLAYAAVYYAVFRFAIVYFDLKTPGREIEAPPVEETGAPVERGAAFVAALGGSANLTEIGACTTRLRLVVVDPSAIDEARLRALGAMGIVRPAPDRLQVVLGPIADMVAAEMQASTQIDAVAKRPTAVRTAAPSAERGEPLDLAAWAAALGGRDNVVEITGKGSRLMLRLGDVGGIDAEALERLGVRAVAKTDRGIHLIVTAGAAPVIADEFVS
jgi:PTS system N-acetylglucosamine-specific IIC component